MSEHDVVPTPDNIKWLHADMAFSVSEYMEEIGRRNTESRQTLNRQEVNSLLQSPNVQISDAGQISGQLDIRILERILWANIQAEPSKDIGKALLSEETTKNMEAWIEEAGGAIRLIREETTGILIPSGTLPLRLDSESTGRSFERSLTSPRAKTMSNDVMQTGSKSHF